MKPVKFIRRMVVGFLFSDSGKRVALLEKNHGPKFLIGKLNGLGGKCEPGESPYDAMVREFQEEAGVHIKEWEEFAKIESAPVDESPYEIHFYRAFGNVDMVRTMESEPVAIYDTDKIPENAYHNLKWLIPLALDEYVDVADIMNKAA